MTYLVVVAHPDDEVLGAGATMYKLAKEGHVLNVLILSGEVTARNHRPNTDELNEDVNNSMNILGVKKVVKGEFPNIEFNTVPHLKLVQFIEQAIIETKADVVITHHRCLAFTQRAPARKSGVLCAVGHAVCLAHVQDRGELMVPEPVALSDFGPGDREGLSLVGQVSCERG